MLLELRDNVRLVPAKFEHVVEAVAAQVDVVFLRDTRREGALRSKACRVSASLVNDEDQALLKDLLSLAT